MKVLHVETGMHLYGGALQALYLINGLAERGHKNVLVCPKGSAVSESVQGSGTKLYAVGMSGDLDFPFIFRLRRIILKEKPDIVHLHSRRGADLMGGVAARLAGVRCVLSRRVDNPEGRLAVKLKYGLYGRVVTISEGIREVLVGEGLAPRKIRCVRSAVDSRAFGGQCDREWFRGEFGLKEGDDAIGVVAQLIERKGHRHLIGAAPEILKRHPGVKFIFFGKGPLEAELRRLADGAGLGDAVIFAGFREDIGRILPCLYAVVHPADMEGLGVSVLQALASGIPVVASAVGGLPEAVRDGFNGLLVPPGDPEALAGALIKLLSDRAMARRMGQAGRSLVHEEFSIDRMVSGNLAVYEELITEAN